MTAGLSRIHIGDLLFCLLVVVDEINEGRCKWRIFKITWVVKPLDHSKITVSLIVKPLDQNYMSCDACLAWIRYFMKVCVAIILSRTPSTGSCSRRWTLHPRMTSKFHYSISTTVSSIKPRMWEFLQRPACQWLFGEVFKYNSKESEFPQQQCHVLLRCANTQVARTDSWFARRIPFGYMQPCYWPLIRF